MSKPVAGQQDSRLFDVRPGRITPGRVRNGVESDLRAAAADGTAVPAALAALMRSLADQCDHLERQLRSRDAKAYDRVPLVQLAQQLAALHATVLAGNREVDPFDDIAGLLAEEAARARTAAALDATRPDPPD